MSNNKDSIYLNQYFEELKLINTGTDEEEWQLLKKIESGDSSAKSRLIEVYLNKTAQIACEYKNQGITAEDLIQEANMALMQCVNEISQYDDLTELRNFIESSIRNHLLELLKQEQDNDTLENRVVERINYILDSLKELEEILGKQANIHELAEFMKLSEEEIMDALELTGDILELEEEHDHDHNH